MKVFLPDGTELELADDATGLDAARGIGEGLARAAIAIEWDGEIRDLARRSRTARRSASSPSATPRRSR